MEREGRLRTGYDSIQEDSALRPGLRGRYGQGKVLKLLLLELFRTKPLIPDQYIFNSLAS